LTAIPARRYWIDAHFLLRVPQALPGSRPVLSKSASL
jgi:hypothetical protein